MSSGLSCDGYKREIYYYVALVLHSLFIHISTASSSSTSTTTKAKRKMNCVQDRDEVEKHARNERMWMRNGKIVFTVSLPSSSSSSSPAPSSSSSLLALFRAIFGQPSVCVCVSKVVWLSNWHTWISGTPKNVQRNEKLFVTFSTGEKIVFSLPLLSVSFDFSRFVVVAASFHWDSTKSELNKILMRSESGCVCVCVGTEKRLR